MCTVYLKKLLLKNSEVDKKCYMYVHSEWNEKQLVKLYVKQSSTADYYEGQVDAKAFEEAAEELEISLDEYLDNLQKVFTTDIGMVGFEIELERENKILRVNKTIDLDIVYVEMQLKECDKNYDMLEIALQIINSNKDSKSKDPVTEKALTNVIGAVEEILHEKEEWKQKMLSRFLLILNEKKMKISKLEQELENIYKERRSTSSVQMDIQDNENAAVHDNSSEDDDFNAPTQRLTLPSTES